MKGKTICKTLGLVLLALLILVVLYVVYVFASYHRVGDQSLSVMHCSSRDAVPMEDAVETGAVYRVSSANAGFGAYSADYSFFMDGGRESRARSRQAVDENMRGIVAFVKGLSPDFALFQEVDTDGTRSWHIAEDAYLSDVMENSEFNEVFAQNYDSPYLFYPLINPHGANQSGILTLSRHPISSAVRRSLPIETSVMKLVDLDRCYSVSRVPVSGGGELVLYDLHLSAYTSDGTIATEQLALLLADMQAEYEKGSWCVAGGDFNKDLLGDSSVYFGAAEQEYSWAMTCSWWRHWTRTIRCPPAATPTVHTTTASMSSPWMASWSPPMLPWTVPLFWIQALPTPITTRYR